MSKRKATLPLLDHFQYTDFETIYEPSEDTYLLCDALRDEEADLREYRPSVILEIGPGSGTVCTYLSTLLAGISPDAAPGSTPLHTVTLAVDVNPRACLATAATARANASPPTASVPIGAGPGAGAGAGQHAPLRVECLVGDLARPLLPRLEGCVDVLLFNPPYVPTEDEEVPSCVLPAASSPSPATTGAGPQAQGQGQSGGERLWEDAPGLEAAWAGGEAGRRVLDRALPLLPRLLSKPTDVHPANPERSVRTTCTTGAGGRAYVILVQENDPPGVAAVLAGMGLYGKVIRSIRARNELLHVMKVTWAPN